MYKKERKQAIPRGKQYSDFLDTENKVCVLLKGALEDLEPYHWHFHAVATQREYYEELLEQLPAGEVLWHFDFKQNVGIPQGPKEGGSWWYANFRVEYTVFGVLVARRGPSGVETTYHTFVSTVLEKGSTLAIRMLETLLPTVPDGTKHLHLLGDCGPRFRRYQFASWALVTVLQTLRASCPGLRVQLAFFAEHHGKGRVDGHFGVSSLWLRQFCARDIVNSPSLLIQAFRLGALHAMKDNPKGPKYGFANFEPGPKAKQF